MGQIKKSVDMEAGCVVINFEDQVEKYKLNDLSEVMIKRLALHGLSQKLGDSYANASADGSDPRERANGVWDNLSNNEWGTERGGGLEEKLAEAEKSLEAYDKMSDEEKRLVAGLGMNRTLLAKNVERAKSAIARRDKKKSEEGNK